MQIDQLLEDDLDDALDGLSDILLSCVHAGASVGFILPFDKPAARTFWSERVFPSVRSGATALFATRVDNHLIGTVQLGLELPPNQPHRADVAKMLVHPDAQRRGVGRALLARAETHARACGKRLLVLDTRSGDPSQKLYASAGFDVAGEIPNYCRNPFKDVLEPTTYMYKMLA